MEITRERYEHGEALDQVEGKGQTLSKPEKLKGYFLTFSQGIEEVLVQIPDNVSHEAWIVSRRLVEGDKRTTLGLQPIPYNDNLFKSAINYLIKHENIKITKVVVAGRHIKVDHSRL